MALLHLGVEIVRHTLGQINLSHPLTKLAQSVIRIAIGVLWIGRRLRVVERVIVFVLDSLAIQNFKIFRSPILGPELAYADVRHKCRAGICALSNKHYEDVGKFFENAKIADRNHMI